MPLSRHASDVALLLRIIAGPDGVDVAVTEQRPLPAIEPRTVDLHTVSVLAWPNDGRRRGGFDRAVVEVSRAPTDTCARASLVHPVGGRWRLDNRPSARPAAWVGGGRRAQSRAACPPKKARQPSRQRPASLPR